MIRKVIIVVLTVAALTAGVAWLDSYIFPTGMLNMRSGYDKTFNLANPYHTDLFEEITDRRFHHRTFKMAPALVSENGTVLSNFREYITLETKIPALPIPDSISTLNEWVGSISASRGITQPRVLFVLDPDNHWRSYWLPPVSEIVRTFALARRPDIPAAVSAQVFEYTGKTPPPLGM